MNLVQFGPTNIVGTGTGQTIAIVIWGDNNRSSRTHGTPTYTGSALDVFDKEFNLPDPPSFTIYNQTATIG